MAPTDDCLVCREIGGVVAVPGGPLAVDELLAVFHAPPSDASDDAYAGHLLVCARRHVPGFAQLTEDEAAAVGMAVARWSRALAQVGAEHVYVARIGHGVAHLHVHLLPRWPGTPEDVRWTEMDDWPGARRLGFEEAGRLADEIRTAARR